jgi:branched-chain amino acid transport system permease protein
MAPQPHSWATKNRIGRGALVFWLFMAALPLIGFVWDDPSFDYWMFMGQSMLIYAIAVLGLNLLTGFNGQISLGHGAFFALGAYIAAILMNDAGWPYWATLPAAAVVCFGAGFLFGFPALKLEGHYLALATFSLAIAVPQLLKHKAITQWTGGVSGLVLEKPDPPFGVPLSPDQWLYYFCLGVAALLFWAAFNLLRGRTGLGLMAIRDHAMAAATMGIDTALYKTIAFGISALFTGVAGALSAITVAYVAPDSFTLQLSVYFLVGLVVGGLASLPGCIIGGVFLVLVQNTAQSISSWAKDTFMLAYDVPPWAIYGMVLLGLMYLLPTGVAGGVMRLRVWAARQLAPRAAEPATIQRQTTEAD